MSRYHKEIFKRNVSDPTNKLGESSVCILGLGGLGSNIAVSLARSGIGRLVLVDFDRVEESNLNRQYYNLTHIGMKKTEAIVDVIRSINRDIVLKVIDKKIDRDNILEIVDKESIICEALDNAMTKSMVVGEILSNYSDKFVVAGSGMAGIGDANSIKTVKRFKNLYICGDDVSDFEEVDGMMAPRVNICAGHQANIILRIIMGIE